MTFDPQHFLNLATKLAIDTNYSDEARYRTSISRAYYAAHLVSRKKLESKGYSFSIDENIHWKVIDCMKKENYHIGDMLFQLKRKRKDADYEVNINITNYMTNYSNNLAEAIIEGANTI